MANIANLIGAGVRKAVGAIPGVDLPSEKQKRVMTNAFSGFEQDIASGMDAGEAQIRALSRAAAGFAAEGMTDQATELRMKLVELVQAQEARDAELDNMRAETGLRRAQTDALGQPDPLNVINMVKLPDGPGAKPEFASVAANDPRRAQELIDQGFIEMAPVTLGSEATTLGEASGSNKPVDRSTQEDLMGQLSMLAGLKTLRAGAANTGILEGPVRGVAAHFGLTLPGEQGATAIDMLAVRRKQEADVQSLIQGIPSNYDAGVYVRTLPNPFAFATQDLYEAQIDLLEQETQALVQGTIAFHKGTDRPIPQHILYAAANLGVNVNAVRPWDGQGDPLGEAMSIQRTRTRINDALQQSGAIDSSFNPMTASDEELDAAIQALRPTGQQ